MFGSEILDVAIGLVLVFLLVSLILTSVQEAIETLLKSRAKDLEQAMIELFQGRSDLAQQFYDHPLVYAYYRGDVAQGTARLPSYIPRETFSAVLTDLMSTRPIVADSRVGEAYRALAQSVGFDAARLRREVEGWFDGAMDRASGRFKRRSQRRIFLIALGASLLLNINAVVIGQHFAVSSAAREEAARLAEATVRSGLPDTSAAINRYDDTLRASGLPIGWTAATVERMASWYPAEGNVRGAANVLLLVVGYLITAFAGMLGAPFWFDALNRLMVIRATVKPKEKSPDEPSNDGGGGGGDDGAAGGADGGNGQGLAPAPARMQRTLALQGDVDGCIADVELQDDELTADVELPPATGGVEGRD